MTEVLKYLKISRSKPIQEPKFQSMMCNSMKRLSYSSVVNKEQNMAGGTDDILFFLIQNEIILVPFFKLEILV